MNTYQYNDVHIIVLAAGKGSRMRSSLPKVLHNILGKSMLGHVLSSIETLNPQGIALVTGHESEAVRKSIVHDHYVTMIDQPEQLGTGHAVQQCEAACVNATDVLIVCGDTPLLRASTLASFIDQHRAADSSISLLSAMLDEPTGYGRVCRDANGHIEQIIEERDANDAIKAIDEVSAGIFCVRKADLFDLIHAVENNNEQGEYYLPDVVSLGISKGLKANAFVMQDSTEMQGVNDRKQLREVTELFQQRIIRYWEQEGVSIEQANTVRIDFSASLGVDCTIRAGTQILGNSHIGDGCEVGPYAVVDRSWLDDDVQIHAFSHLEDAHIGTGSQVGPYARLRPDTKLDEGVKIGNFVEIKKSVIGHNSKVNHLSYIGDTTMGQDCNIGAGTITCNYDGANKHQTIIGDNVFIGSDTKLIAPVQVGSRATLGAGSIITKMVKEDGLTLTVRPEQRYVKDWQRPTKE